jgi:hypothetical protein
MLLLITTLIFFGCNKSDRISLDEGYYFELDDSLRIDLMIEFGFVTKEAINGYMLVQTYQDGIFHLINKSGGIEYSIDRSGDGPKMYSKNLRFATIFDRRFVIMDNRNLHFYEFNHFCEYWKRWKLIIQSKGDPKKLAEAFGGDEYNIPIGFDWREFFKVYSCCSQFFNCIGTNFI